VIGFLSAICAPVRGSVSTSAGGWVGGSGVGVAVGSAALVVVVGAALVVVALPQPATDPTKLTKMTIETKLNNTDDFRRIPREVWEERMVSLLVEGD
jgi:hypothetical protein